MPSSQSNPNTLDSMQLEKALKFANKKVKDGALEDAKLIYANIIQRFPKNQRALKGISVIKKLSAKEFKKLQTPTSEQMGIIVKSYENGNYREVLMHTDQMLRLFPDSDILYNFRGAANVALSEFLPAIGDYNNAIRLNPNNEAFYLNLGLTYHYSGDLKNAIHCYEKAISIKPNYAEAKCNMGRGLHDMGFIDLAIENYREAIKIQPNHAGAYCNLGAAFQEKGNLNEAEKSYKKAIEIQPQYSEAYGNLGVVLEEKGDLTGSIARYKWSIKLDPKNAETHCNLGTALCQKGAIEAALTSFQQAIILNPELSSAYTGIVNALARFNFTKTTPVLSKLLSELLQNKLRITPSSIASAVAKFLKLDSSIRNILYRKFASRLDDPVSDTIRNIAKNPLLLNLMEACSIPDWEIESVLVLMRKEILLSVFSLGNFPVLFKFQSALAQQCFINEYVYYETEKEIEAVDALDDMVGKEIKKGNQPNSATILCLASYKPLSEYSWYGQLYSKLEIVDVLKQQIVEPTKEKLLKKNIPILNKITDEVSSKVKQQYEEHPYPRWSNLALFDSKRIYDIIRGSNLKLFNEDITKIEFPTILVAGCGTGQHSISTASRYRGSEVLAIDLSLTSLAYAKRKTEDLGVTNVNYMQADILDLRKLNKQFDIVESSGVLHHMHDPEDGWKVLTDCLKPGGLMRIGLYSELARRSYTNVQKEIKNLGINPDDKSMQQFRHYLIQSERKELKDLVYIQDFFSLSSLRDLLFHIKEHCFNLNQINKMLDDLGLGFCGFENPELINKFKRCKSYTEDIYDLLKWSAFEKNNPRSFIGMYQFWCQKL
ncbi:MAG: tetratricopeptide repeat protein [Paracoccaceae bacterium]|nr:tetratricopeptide repeat protein [Paracoccaceae bacterium]